MTKTAVRGLSRTGRSGLSLTLCLSLCGLLVGCQAGRRPLPPDREDSATQEVYDAHVRRSESGKLQLTLEAPRIKKYERPKPRTLYMSDTSRRVVLVCYGEDRIPKSRIEAGLAISYDDRNVMEAQDSVVVIDYGSGDTIYLENLIWSSSEDRIYSDRPVRSRNGSRVTEGDGFTSDQRMEHIHITRQRGTIEFQD